jgi:hypothetical protein
VAPLLAGSGVAGRSAVTALGRNDHTVRAPPRSSGPRDDRPGPAGEPRVRLVSGVQRTRQRDEISWSTASGRDHGHSMGPSHGRGGVATAPLGYLGTVDNPPSGGRSEHRWPRESVLVRPINRRPIAKSLHGRPTGPIGVGIGRGLQNACTRSDRELATTKRDQRDGWANMNARRQPTVATVNYALGAGIRAAPRESTEVIHRGPSPTRRRCADARSVVDPAPPNPSAGRCFT